MPTKVDSLLKKLKDQDVQVQIKIIAQIGELGPQGEAALNDLWSFLQDDDIELANAAFESLVRIQKNEDIIQRLLDDNDMPSSKRGRLLIKSPIGEREYLSQFWEKETDTILSLILEVLAHNKPEIQAEAINRLAERPAGTLQNKPDNKMKVIDALWKYLEKCQSFNKNSHLGLQVLQSVADELKIKSLVNDDQQMSDEIRGPLLLECAPQILDEHWAQDETAALHLILPVLNSKIKAVQQRALEWLEKDKDRPFQWNSYEEIVKALGGNSAYQPDQDISDKRIQTLLAHLKQEQMAALVRQIQSDQDEETQTGTIMRLVRFNIRWVLRDLIQEWVQWITFGNRTPLVETAARIMRSSQGVVLPLVEQLEQGIQSNSKLQTYIIAQTTQPRYEEVLLKVWNDDDPGDDNALLKEWLASLLDASDKYAELAQTAQEQRWKEEKHAKELLKLLIEDVFQSKQLIVRRRITKQLADMSDQRFFSRQNEPEKDALYELIKDELEKYAVPILVKQISNESDIDTRESMARILGNVGGWIAIDALVRAVVGEERTRAAREELLAKYYLDPSKEHSQEASTILKRAIDQSERTLRLLRYLNSAIVIVGLGLLVTAFFTALFGNDTRLAASAIGTLGGVGALYTYLLRDPLGRIQQALANLVQIHAAFTSFIWELNLNGTYVQSKYVADGVLTGETIANTSQRIQDAADNSVKLIEEYVIENRNLKTSKDIRHMFATQMSTKDDDSST